MLGVAGSLLSGDLAPKLGACIVGAYGETHTSYTQVRTTTTTTTRVQTRAFSPRELVIFGCFPLCCKLMAGASCRFSGRFLLDTSYSALLGSTVDTCYFQFTEVFVRISYYSDLAFDSRPAPPVQCLPRRVQEIGFLGAALVSTTALV